MKKCTNCGNTQNDDVKFCYNCGGGDFEQVSEEGAYWQQPPNQQDAYQQPPYQQAPYQQSYQQPYQQPVYSNNTEPAKISTFLIFFLLMLIPLFNIVYFIIVAVGGPKYNVSLTNFARASLIWGLIIAAIYIILIIIFGAAFISIFRDGGFNYSYTF